MKTFWLGLVVSSSELEVVKYAKILFTSEGMLVALNPG
jgi:hypothetical protein